MSVGPRRAAEVGAGGAVKWGGKNIANKVTKEQAQTMKENAERNGLSGYGVGIGDLFGPSK